MKKIFNLGSINIDHVYHVPHLVRSGETLASTRYTMGAGGKGFNQSVALARAGANTTHIGCIGRDGSWLRDFLIAERICCTNLSEVPEPTGHAVIQINPEGENAIILNPGANMALTQRAIDTTLAEAKAGDWFLCQNETSLVPQSLEAAKAIGLNTVFNAAPAIPHTSMEALPYVDILIVNETEATALGGMTTPFENIEAIRKMQPHIAVIATLGEEGAIWSGPNIELSANAPACQVVDTTAAGDTFIGFCIASLLKGAPPATALSIACKAAALSVTRAGAASSIPRRSEIGLR